jgi:hypothetical protein
VEVEKDLPFRKVQNSGRQTETSQFLRSFVPVYRYFDSYVAPLLGIWRKDTSLGPLREGKNLFV